MDLPLIFDYLPGRSSGIKFLASRSMPESEHFSIEFSGEKPIPVRKGQTILDAALESGIPHFHACGGNAECSTCRIIVMEGSEYLTPINDKEQRLRNIVPFPPKIRLACQTGVTA